jgi:hypothetical protein
MAKKSDEYIHSEMQIIKKTDPNNPAYKRIHALFNKFTILQTLIQIAEKQGDLEQGYFKRALHTRVKK